MDFLSIQLKIRIIGYQNISLIFTANLQQNRFPIIIYIHKLRSPHIRIKTGVFYLYVQSFNHTHVDLNMKIALLLRFSGNGFKPSDNSLC